MPPVEAEMLTKQRGGDVAPVTTSASARPRDRVGRQGADGVDDRRASMLLPKPLLPTRSCSTRRPEFQLASPGCLERSYGDPTFTFRDQQSGCVTAAGRGFLLLRVSILLP